MTEEVKITRRIGKPPSPEITQWIAYFKKAAKFHRVGRYGGEDLFVLTAARVALVGPTNDDKAIGVYQALVALLFPSTRVAQWASAVHRLPGTREGILHLTKSVKAAATLEPVMKAKFPLMNFLTVEAQIKDPRGYVEGCRLERIKDIKGAFYGPTLEYLRPRLRGVIGDLASPEYMAEVISTIETIE